MNDEKKNELVMKVLMKIGVVAVVMLLSLQASAQTFGIRGGLNLSTVLDKDDDEKYSTEYTMKTGFHGGLTFQYDFSDVVALETGLLLESKGLLFKQDVLGVTVKAKYNPLYIDLPITIKAAYAFDDNFKMFGAIGPYIGLGVGGKIILESSLGGDKEIEKTDIEWGSNEFEDDLQRFDAGLTFGAGVEFGRIQIGVFYDLGLVNISSYKDEGTTVKNRALKISMGYRFGEGGGSGRYPW
jgi:outer membrane protein W